jgi:hypothetical protein
MVLIKLRGHNELEYLPKGDAVVVPDEKRLVPGCCVVPPRVDVVEEPNKPPVVVCWAGRENKFVPVPNPAVVFDD